MGLANLRAVGGPDLQSGRRRTVFRSNTEQVAQDSYPDSLSAVIDLRSDDEIGALEHPLAALPGYRSSPLFDPFVGQPASPSALELEEQYVEWLVRHRRTVAAAFHALAEVDGDVLVCCSAGKDRTGIMSALLARLWGADLDLIGADYALTGVLLADRFTREVAESADEARTRRAVRCEPATMVHLVRHVEGRFGSVAAYLSWLGLSEAEVARL